MIFLDGPKKELVGLFCSCMGDNPTHTQFPPCLRQKNLDNVAEVICIVDKDDTWSSSVPFSGKAKYY